MLANKLKSARIEAGMTQQQVADTLGINRTTYTYYEKGTTTISVDYLKKLAAVYSLNISWFFEQDEAEPRLHRPKTHFSDDNPFSAWGALPKDEREILALYRISKMLGKSKECIELLHKLSREEEDK